MIHGKRWLALAFVLAPLGALALQGCTTEPAQPAYNSHVAAAGNNTLGCELTYSISSWSIIYHAANGRGTVSCNNGRSMHVNLSARGGGLTVGQYQITNGHGTFTGVTNIQNVLGTYALATAHVGVVNSAHAIIMTKGVVSLALTGTGSGWNIGAGLAGFTISRANGNAG